MITLAKRIILLMGAVLFLSTPAFGEYYRYIDDNGMQRYTDDLSSVPIDQRPEVKTYESVKSDPVRPTTGKPSETKVAPKEGSKGGENWFEKASKEADELNRKRQDLDKFHQALREEKETLLKEKPSTRAEKKTLQAYHEKVRALNAKIVSYETRYSAYQKEVDAYNEKYKKQ